MRIISSSTHFLLLVLAVMSGLGAAYVTANGLNSWKSKPVIVYVEPEKPETSTIVVAIDPLRYGTELTRKNLREIEWPKGALPRGAVTNISELLKQKGKTVALSYMEIGEPILKWKITGPGQRASLSAMLSEETKAVTIRVNAVLGVGGFVLPGDHVDVLLTRQEEVQIGTKTVENSYTDVLLQNIRVLAIDQVADDNNNKPSVAKTVTVEVEIIDAQKLILASSVGILSLTLRRAGTVLTNDTQRITKSDLAFNRQDRTAQTDIKPVKKVAENRVAIINVIRALDKSEYRVHRE